mmetsp:Transcript_37435/g.77656  ORF Transcript_37435/g.77656 Transcript_37435/m.77656 type:complete len:82 (+) Transcript_37435:3-248(+)
MIKIIYQGEKNKGKVFTGNIKYNIALLQCGKLFSQFGDPKYGPILQSSLSSNCNVITSPRTLDLSPISVLFLLLSSSDDCS